jgi:quercetin dioxygenase-like cupin family protein
MKNNQAKLPAVLSLKKIITYQPGTVVSRTLLAKKGGTVTLFAFAKGQGLSEHTAPFAAVVQVIDGEAEISLSGKLHRVKAGEAIIMPANQPHSLKAEKKFIMLLTMIKS